MTHAPHRPAPPHTGGDPTDTDLPLDLYDQMVPHDLHAPAGDLADQAALQDDDVQNPDEFLPPARAARRTGPPPLPPVPLPASESRPPAHAPEPTGTSLAPSTQTPEQRAAGEAELTGLLTRLITVKDTLESLEDERRTLTDAIRHLVEAGLSATVAERRPVLRPNRKRQVTYEAFERTFGPDLTRQCASIDLKRADELIRKGQLNKAALGGILTYTEGAPALYLVPVKGERP